MSKPNYLIDMHCHTTRSDGNDEPRELVHKAQALGMKVVAITDHDVVPPAEVFQGGVKVVKGMEISCDTNVEDVHIVALGCDWNMTQFGQLTDAVEASKLEAYKRLTEVLCDNGIRVEWSELLENRKPEDIEKKHIFELMAKKGYTSSWQEAKLLVIGNPILNVKREKPDPVEVLDIVHSAGGIAILAHPYLIDERVSVHGKVITREDYIDRLIDNRLDGIEVCYPYDKTSYKGTKSNEQIWAEVESKYKDAVRVLSGGSDYHADEKKGVTNPRGLGECGIEEEYFAGNEILRKLIDMEATVESLFN